MKLLSQLKNRTRKVNAWRLVGVSFLVGLVGLIARQTYEPGTWLAGWDSLMPELDFGLNFKRALNAVWQEYQGLGLLTGMAHAADLVRIAYLWVLARFVPVQLIRWVYHLSMLGVGTLGTYAFLTGRLFPKSKINRWGRELAAIVGASFYLLNWGTAQYFYAPYEAFSHFWAAFPWLMWALFGVLNRKGWGRWAAFLVVNVLAAPAFHVQTLFVVYSLVTAIVLLLHLVEKRQFKTLFVSLGVAGLMLGANAYWLLPSAYFTLRDTDVTRESKINIMATRETFYRNQERGKASDFLLLRGYYLDFKDWIGDTTDYFMPAWREKMAEPAVANIGYGLVVLSVVGLWGRSKKAKYLGIMWAVAGVTMMTAVWPFSSFNEWLRQVPVLDQIFRAPFNKFVVVVIFAQAGLATLGLELVLGLLSRVRSAQLAVSAVLIGALAFSVSPVFEGELVYFNLKEEIPQKYFDLMGFMQRQDPKARIANLPQLSFWGWTNYAWGGRGSGFLWYGIEQPILDRAFDVWSDKNEQYFWQIRYAYQTQDAVLLGQLIDKYQVGWVLIDDDVLTADAKPVDYERLREFVEETGRVEAKFDFDNLTLYQVRHDQQAEGFVEVRQLRSVSGDFDFVWKDQIYADGGGYCETDSSWEKYFVPTLFSDRAQEVLEFSVDETDREYSLTVGEVPADSQLILPSLTVDMLVPVRLWATRGRGQTELEIEYLRPEVRVNGQNVVTNPRESLYVGTDQSLYLAVNNSDFFLLTGFGERALVGETYLKRTGVNSLNFYALEARQDTDLGIDQFSAASVCGPEVEGAKVSGTANEAGDLVVEAQKTANCMSAPLNFLPRKNSLFRIEYTYQSVNGGVPKYCLADTRWYTCYNRKDDNRLVVSDESVSVVELAEAEDFVENGLVLTLIAEALESDEMEGVAYGNLHVSIHPLVAQGGVSLENKQQLLGTGVVTLPNGGSVQVAIPKLVSRYNYEQPIQKDLVGKESVVVPFLYQPQGQGYLFTVNSSAGQRLPTRAWVENHHLKRGETDSYLLASSKLGQSRIYMPPISDFYDGYYLHFDNPKYAGEEGVNRLDTVRVQVWPYEYLKRLKVVDNQAALLSNSEQVVFSVQEESYWQYRVAFEPGQELGKRQLLILNQGFDPAWTARVGHPWRGEKLAQVKVNNWANGWALSDDLAGQTVYLVYWPQWLEYAGFAAFVAALAGLGVMALSRGAVVESAGHLIRLPKRLWRRKQSLRG